MGSVEAQLGSTPEPTEKGVGAWPFLLISVILVLSISFEILKESVEHHTPKEFEPITDAFFGELATLGFIGAIAFTLTYNFDSDCEGTCTVMQHLSDRFLGEPGELQEIFELLHFMLFAVSVVFIFAVLALLCMTLQNAAKYTTLEGTINKATAEAANKTRKRVEQRRLSSSSGSRSRSPSKKPRGSSASSPDRRGSPTRHASQTHDPLALQNTIRNYEHEREARKESEDSLMRSGAPSSPGTPNHPALAGLLSWGHIKNVDGLMSVPQTTPWFIGTMFEHWLKSPEMYMAEYFRLRHRFIDDEQESVSVSIPHDFDYGKYLKKTLAHSYAHIIEISPVDWGVLWMVMGMIYSIYFFNPNSALYIFALFEAALLLLSCKVLTKIMHIRSQLLSPTALGPPVRAPLRGHYAPPSLDLIDETSTSTRAAENRGTAGLILNTTDLVAPTAVPPTPQSDNNKDKSLSAKTGVTLAPPPYLKLKYQFHNGTAWHQRLKAVLYGKTVNRHQSLFWMGAHGVTVIFHMIKLVLFASVVNMAVLMVNVRPQIMDLQIALPLRYLLLVAGMIVPMITLVIMPVTIGYLNIITSIETMKKEGLLVEVIKAQKYEKHQQALDVLKSLQFFMHKIEMLAKGGGGGIHASSGADVSNVFEEYCKDPATKGVVEEFQTLFIEFDKDKSGAIERDELGALLECMGQQKSEDELDRLFNLMDADGSQDVDFEEFCVVMLANRKNSLDPLAMAEKMYLHFDVDGDGQVSPDEMIEAFQNLGDNWDVDSIHSFLFAMDADGSGTIEKQEFITFVTGFLTENND